MEITVTDREELCAAIGSVDLGEEVRITLRRRAGGATRYRFPAGWAAGWAAALSRCAYEDRAAARKALKLGAHVAFAKRKATIIKDIMKTARGMWE